MRKKILTLLLAILTAGGAVAKTINVELDYNGSYSDNILLNASGMTDYVSRLQAEINYSLKAFDFYLNADAGIHMDHREYDSYQLEPGAAFLRVFKNRNSVYLGVAYNILRYNENYTDFNYSGPKADFHFKRHLGKRTILKLGYRFHSRNYVNFNSFDFRNHNAFAELHHLLPGQTTLRLQAGFNYRYYPHVGQNLFFGTEYDYFETGKQGNLGHHGQIGWTGGGSGGHGGHGGHGGGQGNGTPPPIQYADMSIPNYYGTLHVSQAIGTRVALSGEAEWRYNAQGLESAQALIKNAYLLYPNNDDYLWDGTRLNLQLKAVVLKSVAMEVSASYYNKSYEGIFVMNSDGTVNDSRIQRKDHLTHLSLRLSKQWGKADIYSHFSYRDNGSNDPYFQFNMVTLGGGIRYRF